MTKSHVLAHIYMQMNDINFKYIWAGGRDLKLTSVAHLRKKAELKLVGSWRGKCTSLFTGSSV